MNPALIFQRVASQSRSVILTSGTLTPMDSFASEVKPFLFWCLAMSLSVILHLRLNSCSFLLGWVPIEHQLLCTAWHRICNAMECASCCWCEATSLGRGPVWGPPQPYYCYLYPYREPQLPGCCWKGRRGYLQCDSRWGFDVFPILLIARKAQNKMGGERSVPFSFMLIVCHML
jgi:hypothetical protein